MQSAPYRWLSGQHSYATLKRLQHEQVQRVERETFKRILDVSRPGLTGCAVV